MRRKNSGAQLSFAMPRSALILEVLLWLHEPRQYLLTTITPYPPTLLELFLVEYLTPQTKQSCFFLTISLVKASVFKCQVVYKIYIFM